MIVYFLYILIILISLYIFWVLAKEEGFINEDIFDLCVFLGILGGLLYFLLRLDWEYIFLVTGVVFLLFTKIKRWSLKKTGDTAIIPFILFLYLFSALKVVTDFSASTLILFGILGFVLSFLVYLRGTFFLGISAKRARMSRFFGTFLNGGLFYLGLLFVSMLAIIFLVDKNYVKGIYGLIFLFSLISIIIEVRKTKNSKMIKEQIVDKVKERLLKKKAELDREEKMAEMEDSYKVSGRDSDNADILSDVDEDVSHEITVSTLSVIKRAKDQIKKSLARIKKGKYGVCEKCKGKIDPA
ncbi:MAG: hypothetical protein ABIB98_01505, partial [bacterium]